MCLGPRCKTSIGFASEKLLVCGRAIEGLGPGARLPWRGTSDPCSVAVGVQSGRRRAGLGRQPGQVLAVLTAHAVLRPTYRNSYVRLRHLCTNTWIQSSNVPIDIEEERPIRLMVGAAWDRGGVGTGVQSWFPGALL